MTESKADLSNRALRTPRAAAIAGILFAVLAITSHVLIRLSVPADLLDPSDWLEDQAKTVALAMSLVPFAGISFLWFMGVVRDRMGRLEDQFFSTLFFGSGYLYLGMTFASAAIAGGVLTLYALDPGMLIGSEGYAHGRHVYVRPGHHLGSYPGDAALAGLGHLCPGGGAADQHWLYPVGGPGLSGLGLCDQRLHPDSELPGPAGR